MPEENQEKYQHNLNEVITFARDNTEPKVRNALMFKKLSGILASAAEEIDDIKAILLQGDLQTPYESFRYYKEFLTLDKIAFPERNFTFDWDNPMEKVLTTDEYKVITDIIRSRLSIKPRFVDYDGLLITKNSTADKAAVHDQLMHGLVKRLKNDNGFMSEVERYFGIDPKQIEKNVGEIFDIRPDFVYTEDEMAKLIDEYVAFSINFPPGTTNPGVNIDQPDERSLTIEMNRPQDLLVYVKPILREEDFKLVNGSFDGLKFEKERGVVRVKSEEKFRVTHVKTPAEYKERALLLSLEYGNDKPNYMLRVEPKKIPMFLGATLDNGILFVYDKNIDNPVLDRKTAEYSSVSGKPVFKYNEILERIYNDFANEVLKLPLAEPTLNLARTYLE
jgi:hypothetical protein